MFTFYGNHPNQLFIKCNIYDANNDLKIINDNEGCNCVDLEFVK